MPYIGGCVTSSIRISGLYTLEYGLLVFIQSCVINEVVTYSRIYKGGFVDKCGPSYSICYIAAGCVVYFICTRFAQSSATCTSPHEIFQDHLLFVSFIWTYVCYGGVFLPVIFIAVCPRKWSAPLSTLISVWVVAEACPVGLVCVFI